MYGTAAVGGRECVLVSFEFGFLGGSLGSRTGDRLEAAYTLAAERRLPLVSLVATGGSRMQEGMIALVQLQRVARASTSLRAAGLAQIAVLRDPTTGRGWATVVAPMWCWRCPGRRSASRAPGCGRPTRIRTRTRRRDSWRPDRSTRSSRRRSCP